MVVAYPLLSLDQIGIELQSPFACDRLSHLPLDEIATNIEKNVRGFQVDLQGKQPLTQASSHDWTTRPSNRPDYDLAAAAEMGSGRELAMHGKT